MWTISEADVTVGFAVDAKCKGILEHLLVTVARREAKDNPVTLGHSRVAPARHMSQLRP